MLAGKEIALASQMLAVLDPVTRARLEHSDWQVRPASTMFQRHRLKAANAIEAEVKTFAGDLLSLPPGLSNHL